MSPCELTQYNGQLHNSSSARVNSRQIAVNREQKVSKGEKLAHHVSSQLAESPRENPVPANRD